MHEQILVCIAVVERELLHLRIRELERKLMPGEIRKAMAGLRQSKETMISGLLAEIKQVESEIGATHADGMDALKLPRAELAATKQEIAEIRAEFAEVGNEGDKLGPLPPPPNGSVVQSAAPVASTNAAAEKKIIE